MDDEIKVSELPQASQVNAADLLMIIQGEANKKASAQLLANFILDMTHPIGSLYWSTNNTDPGTLFGGTWERIKDKFILAAGDTYTAGNTGGEATHTLTTNEMPSHNHQGLYWLDENRNVSLNTGSQYPNGYQTQWQGTADDTKFITGKTGGGQAHNNMPPYLVAYCWKRTA